MITHKIVNIVDAEVDALCQQCNCFHIQGAGVAKAIREKYPEVYGADCKTVKGSKTKLGTFSKVRTYDKKIVYNVYSQFSLSKGDRATQYDMVDIGLRAVEQDVLDTFTTLNVIDKPITLGIPFKYGCALGGGSWKIVEAIIHDIFDNSPLDILLCEWPAPTINNNWVDSFKQIEAPSNFDLDDDIFPNPNAGMTKDLKDAINDIPRFKKIS